MTILRSYLSDSNGKMGIKLFVNDGFGSTGGNSRSSSMFSVTLDEESPWGATSIESGLIAGAGKPCSISLIERTGVHGVIDGADDGSKMVGYGTLASVGVGFEVNGRYALSIRDQSRFKSRAMLECELQWSSGRRMVHSLRMRVTKRWYM